YTPDPNLSATAQLDLRTLGRLIEGIQIFEQLPKSLLITSAFAHKNTESQASVARRAAIELGLPKEKIDVLETPSNTWEEVQAFKARFGDTFIPIVVTDASHMPRAIKMFQAAGFNPIAAPTNYKVKHGRHSSYGFSLPNVQSIQLMDSWLHEVLAEWKWRVW
ncbi:MAG: ElyC/SanA/YdcF family protein, partial [Lutimonas sp.]